MPIKALGEYRDRSLRPVRHLQITAARIEKISGLRTRPSEHFERCLVRHHNLGREHPLIGSSGFTSMIPDTTAEPTSPAFFLALILSYQSDALGQIAAWIVGDDWTLTPRRGPSRST